MDVLGFFFSVSDSASDTEVPYADIMITIRGVSTPELNQVVYLSPGDQNQVRSRFFFFFFLKPMSVCVITLVQMVV